MLVSSTKKSAVCAKDSDTIVNYIIAIPVYIWLHNLKVFVYISFLPKTAVPVWICLAETEVSSDLLVDIASTSDSAWQTFLCLATL